MIDLKLFGPLAAFVGTWQGSKGDDTAPDDFRANHEQVLYVVSYTRTAWRLNAADPFHEQLGYWLWDPMAKQVMRSFIIPRGMTR